MQGKILFLGEESSSGRGFVEPLKKSSFQVIFDENPEYIKNYIENREISLLVCAMQPEAVGWATCIELMNLYPSFPMLFILAQDSSIEPQLIKDGFHRLIRPLTKRSEFVRCVKDLVQVGCWTKKETATTITTIPDFFDSLDINLVIDKLLQHFGKRVECKNIYWLQCSELGRYLQAKEAFEELDTPQKYNRSVSLQALHDTTEAEAFGVLDHFSLSRKFMGRAISLSCKDGFSRDHLLVPIKGSRGAEDRLILAYLVFENVQAENTEFLLSQVNETISLLSNHIEYSIEYWNVRSETFMDDLTELYNQKYLGLVLDNEINRASRKTEKFSVLFLDIDFFKVVNDTRGHWIGSKVLIELGKMLKNTIRNCDYAFRYGGDEYVLILPDTAEEGAKVVAERIREKIEKHSFLIDGMELNLTVSIGLATYPDHAETQSEIIKMADEAMYCGKNKSRNIVYVAG